MRHRILGAGMLLAMAAAASPAASQAPAGGAQAAAPRPSRLSWTSDRREFSVGDVITVIIDESTLASANKGNLASDLRLRDASVRVGQSVVPTVPSSAGADFGTQNDAESRQRGEATRHTRFSGEMSARVTEVEPGGRVRIEGVKTVSVDKHREALTIKGWVRAQDVSADNMVDSWRIGDAEIAYDSKGSLGKPRSGIISRLLGALWP